MVTLLGSFLDSFQCTCCRKVHWQDASSLQNEAGPLFITLCFLWGSVWTFLETIVWPLTPPGCPSSSPLRLVFRILERLLTCVCVCVCVCAHAQSCPTLYDFMDYSPPGSPVHEIFQARILEKVAIFSTRGSSQPWGWTLIFHVSCWHVDSLPLHHLGSPRLWVIVTSRVERPRTLLCSQAVYLAVPAPSILSHESLSKFLMKFVP